MPRRGFTLIEIMVVVLVIAILSTLAIPQFIGSGQRAALTSSSEQLVATLRYLQRQAILTQHVHQLRLTPEDPDSGLSTYVALVAAVDLDEPQDMLPLTAGPIKPTTLPREVRFLELQTAAPLLDQAATGVSFYPDGSADAAVIVLANETQTQSILIEPHSGKVTSVEGTISDLPNVREDLDV